MYWIERGAKGLQVLSSLSRWFWSLEFFAQHSKLLQPRCRFGVTTFQLVVSYILCLKSGVPGVAQACARICIFFSTCFWLVVWNINFIFPYIGNFIIPIDFHIFQRGKPTTNQVSTFNPVESRSQLTIHGVIFWSEIIIPWGDFTDRVNILGPNGPKRYPFLVGDLEHQFYFVSHTYIYIYICIYIYMGILWCLIIPTDSDFFQRGFSINQRESQRIPARRGPLIIQELERCVRNLKGLQLEVRWKVRHCHGIQQGGQRAAW